MPGYIYVYSDELIVPKQLKPVEGFMYMLDDGEGNYALTGADEVIAREFLKFSGCLGISKCKKVCGRLVAVEGPLVDFEVIKVEWGRQRALVSFGMAKVVNTSPWLDFDWVG
ncbi:hypothetical protein FACS1894184_15360 [Clostridia bacterium]|nr:hypothetical protein FACS1894184_15360 [Clostridia bacterium]